MKHKLFVLGTVLLAVALHAPCIGAQPVNDDCANALEIFAGDVVSGTTADATGTSVSSCSVDDFYDVWYAFTPNESGFFTISLCGSDFETTLAVYDGCGGTTVACNDKSLECDTRSQITCAELTGAQTYLIRVAGYISRRGNYVLSLEQCSSPSNDLCENAAALNKYEEQSSSTFAATGTGLTTCSTSDLYDVWYTYTPAYDEEVNISLCGSSFDTTLSVFDSCGGTRLACNDDSAQCSYAIHSSLSNLSLNGGDTYLVRVAGYESRRGYYKINMTDAGSPIATSIVPADPGPTASSSVFFYVYFSTSIIGFDDVSDLIITANGVTYDDVQFSPSDDAWDVEFTGVQGNGELSIAVNTASDVRRPDDVPLVSSVTSAPVIIDTTAPVVSNVTITPAVAVAGDTVQIDFESNEPLELVEVLVNGNSAEPSKALYSYTYQVTEADAVGPAEIQISIFDLAGNVAFVTENAQLVIQQAPELPLAAPPLAIALTFAGLWRLRQRRRG